MNNKNKTQKNKNGFTIIEALTLLFIFSVILVTFYSVFTSGSRLIIESKNRLGALALANEKMEIVRNLDYNSIGTVGGEVNGAISQDEDVAENNRQYHVSTLVEYVDDPYDGLDYSDTIWFEDYKRVTINISWTGGVSSAPVKLVSRFSPHGVEQQNPNDGILSINVFSKQPGGSSEALSGTKVHVTNSDIGLDTEKNTDSDGNVTFMGSNIRNSIQKYHITLTKSGYETVSTMPPYPDTPYNPTDVHVSVVTGSVNIANIFQNKLANLKIVSTDLLNQSVPDISFHIKGGRKMGTTISSNDPVYNLDEDSATEADGEKEYSDISPGQYDIAPSPGVNYELIRLDPASPYTLLSASPATLKIKLADKNVTSLLATVTGGASNEQIEGATVQLKSDTLGYDNTQTTPVDGKVFFPVSADVFQAGVYDLKITASGYSDSNTQVTINADQLKMETINLTAL
jgi:competence protein ComGC